MEVDGVYWLAEARALDCRLASRPQGRRWRALEEALAAGRIDAFITVDDGERRKRLLVADMDSTVIVGETLEELAAHCGLKETIAAITDRAMRGR